MKSTFYNIWISVCAAMVVFGTTGCDFKRSMPTLPTPVENPAPGGHGGGTGRPPEPAAPETAMTRPPDPGAETGCWDTAGHHRDHCLPMPDMYAVVRQVAEEFPGALQNSCQEHGGSWEFMDRVVDRLRERDTRWGYNGKRGNASDPSLDAIAYHFGGGPDHDSGDVHVVDIIGGHCGPHPGPAWINVTNFHGAGAVWTSRGRF